MIINIIALNKFVSWNRIGLTNFDSYICFYAALLQQIISCIHNKWVAFQIKSIVPSYHSTVGDESSGTLCHDQVLYNNLDDQDSNPCFVVLKVSTTFNIQAFPPIILKLYFHGLLNLPMCTSNYYSNSTYHNLVCNMLTLSRGYAVCHFLSEFHVSSLLFMVHRSSVSIQPFL